jgi:hypothetical protein
MRDCGFTERQFTYMTASLIFLRHIVCMTAR